MKSAAFYVLLVLVLLSLALNVIILAGLLTARQALVEALDESLEAMSGLESETFETTIDVKQNIPVQLDVPFRRELNVPIKLDVPISDEITFEETLSIPINTLVGTYNVRVPISTTVPINLNVPIDTEIPFTLSETIPISTSIGLDMQIPVVIEIGDTRLAEYLGTLRETLLTIRQRLSFGAE